MSLQKITANQTSQPANKPRPTKLAQPTYANIPFHAFPYQKETILRPKNYLECLT